MNPTPLTEILKEKLKLLKCDILHGVIQNNHRQLHARSVNYYFFVCDKCGRIYQIPKR